MALEERVLMTLVVGVVRHLWDYYDVIKIHLKVIRLTASIRLITIGKFNNHLSFINKIPSSRRINRQFLETFVELS